VFITFMSDLIGRWMTDTHKAEGMRKVFDTEDWRTLIGLQGITQQKAAVELYASQLMKRAREQGKRLYVFPINVAYENRPGIYTTSCTSPSIRKRAWSWRAP
jgi:hypothetical protein